MDTSIYDHHQHMGVVQQLDLGPIKARLAEVSPGPWEAGAVDERNSQHGLHLYGVDDYEIALFASRDDDSQSTPHSPKLSMAEANCQFTAHARTDVPALIAEVERLRAQNQDLSILRMTPTEIDAFYASFRLQEPENFLLDAFNAFAAIGINLEIAS